MRRQAALRREQPSAARIPYRSHVSPHLVRTEAGDYVQVFRLAGASFESVDDDVLNNWHERLNVLWRNVASANTALWMHHSPARSSHDALAGAAGCFVAGCQYGRVCRPKP
jgi:type IV secretion system protein VirB4